MNYILSWNYGNWVVSDKVFCFHWSALPEVRSSCLRRRRWIWNLHPWLPPLQKEDSYVSTAKQTLKLVPAASVCERFLCVYVYSDAAETVIHSADAFAPVGYLRFTGMHTESKDSVSRTSEGIHECNLFYK